MVKPTNRRHFGTAESIGLSTACGIALCSHDAHPQYERDRCVTGIAGLDEILRGGIPYGSTVLVAGTCGSGKDNHVHGILGEWGCEWRSLCSLFSH